MTDVELKALEAVYDTVGAIIRDAKQQRRDVVAAVPVVSPPGETIDPADCTDARHKEYAVGGGGTAIACPTCQPKKGST